MPPRQTTEANRTRRLKKADFEVDFFFINGVKFSLWGEPETVVEMLGEMLERCQLLFLEFLIAHRSQRWKRWLGIAFQCLNHYAAHARPIKTVISSPAGRRNRD